MANVFSARDVRPRYC